MQQESVAIGQRAPASSAWAGHAGAATFAIHTADSSQHRGLAGQLVQRRYLQRGYLRHNSMATPAEPPPQEAQLVVLRAADAQGRTLGTLGVRFESEQHQHQQMGLNAEQVFAPELAALREQAGGGLCEFTRLAVDADTSSKRMLAALFHSAYLHAYRLRGRHTLVIEVNPRHVAFYRRMLNFRVCSETRMNPRVNAPAVLLCLDLRQAESQIARCGGRPDMAAHVRSLYPYFYSPEQEAQQLAQLRAGQGASAALM